MLFPRDLRHDDNNALAAALDSSPQVLPAVTKYKILNIIYTTKQFFRLTLLPWLCTPAMAIVCRGFVCSGVQAKIVQESDLRYELSAQLLLQPGKAFRAITI